MRWAWWGLPGAKCQVPSAKCQVPSAKCQVPSAKCQVPSAKCQVPSAKCQVPSAAVGSHAIRGGAPICHPECSAAPDPCVHRDSGAERRIYYPRLGISPSDQSRGCLGWIPLSPPGSRCEAYHGEAAPCATTKGRAARREKPDARPAPGPINARSGRYGIAPNGRAHPASAGFPPSQRRDSFRRGRSRAPGRSGGPGRPTGCGARIRPERGPDREPLSTPWPTRLRAPRRRRRPGRLRALRGSGTPRTGCSGWWPWCLP